MGFYAAAMTTNQTDFASIHFSNILLKLSKPVTISISLFSPPVSKSDSLWCLHTRTEEEHMHSC